MYVPIFRLLHYESFNTLEKLDNVEQGLMKMFLKFSTLMQHCTNMGSGYYFCRTTDTKTDFIRKSLCQTWTQVNVGMDKTKGSKTVLSGSFHVSLGSYTRSSKIRHSWLSTVTKLGVQKLHTNEIRHLGFFQIVQVP